MIMRKLLIITIVCAAGLLGPTAAFGGPPPGQQDENPAFVVPSAHQFGQYGTHAGQLLDPSGVAIDDADQVYVADCAAHHVLVFTLDGELRRTIGDSDPTRDPAETRLACPRGLVVVDDSLYVVDAPEHRVVRYSRAGAFGGAVVDDPQLRDPYGISATASEIVISDPGTQTVRRYDATGHTLGTCGGAGSTPGTFASPRGIALDGSGGFFVADQENARIQHLRPDCSVAKLWGRWGSFPGELAEPAGLAFVADRGATTGKLYVADLTNHRVQVFSHDGQYLYEWGRHPAISHQGNGRVHYPELLAVDPTGSNVVACEPFEIRCQTWDTTAVQHQVTGATDSAFWNKFPKFHYGSKASSIILRPEAGKTVRLATTTLSKFTGLAIAEPDISQVVVLDWGSKVPSVFARIGGYGTAPGQFRQPTGLAFDDRTGELYISDGNGHRIQVFTLDGQFIRSFGTFGDTAGTMNGPSGISFDDHGDLWVAEADANRIDVFTKAGQFVRSIGGPGKGPLQFNKPLSVYFSSRLKRVYVTDTYNHRVQILTPDGKFVRSFGTDGAGPGQFIDSIDLTLDDHNNVYLADPATDRVLKFNQDGEFIKEWGSFGSALGQFYKPKGTAILGDKLVVIDFGNHRGQLFTLEGTPLGVFGEGIVSPTGDPRKILLSSTSHRRDDRRVLRTLVVSAVVLTIAAITVRRRAIRRRKVAA
jgi:tripartite motif-containing protein 71